MILARLCFPFGVNFSTGSGIRAPRICFFGIAIPFLLPIVEEMELSIPKVGSNISTALVTGATSGIGECVAHGLARGGWMVLVHGRTSERARAAIARMGDLDGRCVSVDADLQTRGGVARLLNQVRVASPNGVNVLVNSAGAAFPRRELTSDGVERTIAVNHLAVAAITEGLQPLLLRAGARSDTAARVIVLTSYLEARAVPVDDWTYERGWGQLRAYTFSKLLNLAYSYALAEQWADEIGVYAVDPGAVRTGFQRSAGGALRMIGAVGGLLMSSPQHSAKAVLEAAGGQPAHPTGSYIRNGRTRTSSARSTDAAFQREVYERTRQVLAC